MCENFGLQLHIDIYYCLVFKQPSSLTIEDSTEQSVNLSWTPPNDDGVELTVGDYVVTWYANNNDDETIESESTDADSIQILNLQSNTQYTFSVAARSKNNPAIIGDKRTGDESTRKLF